MTKELAELLVEAAQNNGSEAKIRESYSGRGMYGQETFGVVVDSEASLIVDLLQYIRDNIADNEDAEGNEFKTWKGKDIPGLEISCFRVDNLGGRVIIY